MVSSSDVDVRKSYQKGSFFAENLPKSVDILEGKPLKLTAKVEGEPISEVEWTKDGKPLKPSNILKIETKPDGTICLSIDFAKPQDSGRYGLIAKTPSGELATYSEVAVEKGDLKEVAFEKKLPDSVNVVEGKPLKLTAKLEGEPLPETQWTKDDVPIRSSDRVKIESQSDGTVSLSIDCAKPKDVGKYAIIAKTPSGELVSSSDVDIRKDDLKGPYFAEKFPITLSISEGKPFNLIAKVEGEPVTKAVWTKDNKPIKFSDSVKVESKPDGTVSLNIENVKPADAGQYLLTVLTPKGKLSSMCDVEVVQPLCDVEVAQTPITDNKKPEFIKSLLPLSIEEGKPCRLECQVSGQINSISWFKKGEEIKPNEHFGFVKEPNGTIALLIDAIGPQDAGEYRVVVKNNAGEAFSSAPVEMVHKAILREKPIFLEQLSPSNVMEGNELRMTAKIKSNLPLSVKWMKDGVEIEANDRIKMSQLPDGTVILNINNANLDDAGKYVVVAINDEGRTRSSAAASVGPKKLSKPEILEGLEPTTLTSGQPGKLSVKTSGEPTPDVRFIKDGKQLIPNDRVHIKSGPEGKVELIFDDVKPEDEGKYIAVAVNDVGETRSSAPVVVNRSPKFEQPLKEMTGIEGYPAKLETKVEGRPKPDIEWTKDGETLKPDESHFKAFTGDDGTHALLIDNCTPDDSGTYGVIASNPFGKTETSAPFTVKSKSDESGPEFAPGFVDSLQDILVNEGEPMIFVTTIKANPMPSIEWFFEGKPIKSSENIQISFDGIKAQLKIAKCNVHNKGLYEVKISNSLGDATSKAVGNIVEKSAPKFIQRLTDTESGITEPLKLICRVKGFPEPNIEWYFNGSRIEPGINYSIFKELDVCTLVIVKPKDKDSGLYECKATNICGTDSSKANITFSDQEGKGEAVSFLKQLGDCEVRPGKIAKFTACVTGSPRPEIKWFKGGVEFEPSGHKYNVEYHRNGMIRFEIRDVEESDLGEYRCHASNIHGYDNSKAQLTFESLDDKHKRKPAEDESDKYKKSGIPVPLPDKPRITRMNDQDLTLSWLPSIPIQPRIPVTYIVEWAKAPDGEWVAFRTGIKDSQCDVHGLSTGEDYSFRIRVENKFGISDPSPYVTAFRSKLQPPIQPTSQKPKGFELEHPPLDKQATAPRFLREEEEVVYGIRGQPVTIEFWVYAHPDPNIIWSFEGEKLQMGGKYDSLQDRNGQICLFITRMTESDVGIYSCLATNERGEAIKRIKLLIAEPPVFTKLLEETTVFSHRHARLECTVIGVPEPTVKWYKDWQPIHESNRIKILWESPDRATLFINGAITRDAGLYSCTASNIAGNASTSAMLHIEESEIEYDKYTFGYHKLIKPKTKPFEEFYDIGDELGRGTQGIVYHSVERTSGKSYASKMMHGKDQMREYMNSELDIMNQLGYHPKLIRIWDAFASTPHSLTLITDLCGGGELLECILQKATLTESDVAYYVRQILQGIEYLHFKNIAHFGLTIGDVLVERVNGNDIKIGDFGLAQRVIPGINYYVEFGHPEFVAPEILNKEPATFVSDVWSAGIITYLLLTGISPFLGENDRQTLQNLQTGKIDLTNETLADISDEGRDFLSKVLVFDPHRRLDVKSALQHPWLRRGDQPGIGDQLHSLQNLRLYRKKWKSWYMNASCKTYYRRRPLHSCFTHPSRMIYPPDEQYTPPPSPEREVRRSKFKPSQFDETMKQKISRDPIDAHSESQYQCGPDTYLLQLRDTDFATRIRQYLRVGASRSPSLAASLKEPHWGDSNIGYGYSPQVAVRERRKFTDIMDEEIGDEKKGLETRPKPTRLLREVGTSGYAYGQLYHMKKEASVNVGKDIHSIHESKAPFFREKLKDITIKENDDVVFSCYAIGSPPPSYTWFRNDGILIESSRIEVKRTNEGRCELRIKPARAYDTGYYKCVARNTEGAVVCRSRLNIGDSPGMPEPPQVKDGSDTEIYLCWSPPKDEGHCHIVCYKLEYQKTEESNWTVVADNIMHEFYVVRNLEPENSYYFRISARNKFGWSIPSFYSEMAKTLASGDAVRIKVPASRIYRQLVTERSAEVTIDDMLSIPNIDYSKEQNPIPLITEEHNNLYKFISEISRGRFSLITKTFVNELDSTLVSKAVLTQSEIESGIYNEYETMKSLANERIVELHYASRGSSIYVLSMESLSGIDVLTFLSQRQKYTEELVSKIIIQVMDAIEYLHFRGICLLELQPDNVLIINQRKHDIKLCDFANARRVPIAGSKVTINGTPEYIAPELIKNEEVSQSTDIWCVGVLTYILLSGVSPFRGSTDSETAQNVVYVRYLFDQLYPEITQEAIRFILTIFKLTPHKRPTVEECADHKWLLPNEFMIKKRESAVFSSHKLTEFADEFHSAKSRSMPSRLANIAGISLARSDSLLNDKYEEF